MTAPPAWPQTDEDVLQQRSDELRTALNGLSGVVDTWRGKKSAIFNNNGWFGGAASAAERMVGAEIAKMEELKQRLSHAIAFYDAARQATIDAKNQIVADTNAAQDYIDDLESQMGVGDSVDPSAEIEQKVRETFSSNSAIVRSATDGLDSKLAQPNKTGGGASGPAMTPPNSPPIDGTPQPASGGSGPSKLLHGEPQQRGTPAVPVGYRGPADDPLKTRVGGLRTPEARIPPP
ncbi:MAG: hypothetical protein QOE04_5638, partial [Mycobacterium sp.]|nr:hypothetical protein [Mycobacterium sp.]